MGKGLRVKFLLLLLGVTLLSLCSALAVRELMLRDFNSYLEGETEDRVYWILAHLEGSFERNGAWEAAAQAEDALWALNLGFEMRLFDREGRPVMDTQKALVSASPLVKRRVKALSEYRAAGTAGEFFPYPLFLAGVQVGNVELKELKPAKEALFVRRSDLFLLSSLVLLGGLAVLMGVFMSRRLTRPIVRLTDAARDLSRGRYGTKVEITRKDEVGTLADAFNRMGTAIETHETLRRKMIADVAHELRTPLGVMRAEMEAMIDGLVPLDRERLESLYDETGRLRHIVDGIEELNQAEAGRLSLQRREIPLAPFLEAILSRFRAGLDGTIAVDLVTRDDPVVFADPDRLSQIVLNLLSNAVRALAPGGTIRVTAGKEGKEGFFTVEDTGSGIREEDLPFIFERFYKGSGGGLGIGLTIVKELVDAQEGRVAVKSSPGEGSSFTVYLPGADVHNSS